MRPLLKETPPPIRIGIDLLGADFSAKDLAAVLCSSYPFALTSPPLHLILFGTPELFSSCASPPGITLLSVTEKITMDETPLVAVRQKQNSSLVVGIKQLQRGNLDAFISGGNTGALLAAATLSLPRLPHIERPALLALLPTKKGALAVIDVGAGLHQRASHLIQFAKMGVAYQKTGGIPCPRVALLNVGQEEEKGTLELKRAYGMLRTLAEETHFSFVGNVEGRSIFDGDIDVLVTDGFTGNVLLKTAEGALSLVLEMLRDSLKKDRKELDPTLLRYLHYASYPGALLCGVKGIVMKCHGESTPEAFVATIKEAYTLVYNGLLERLSNQL